MRYRAKAHVSPLPKKPPTTTTAGAPVPQIPMQGDPEQVPILVNNIDELVMDFYHFYDQRELIGRGAFGAVYRCDLRDK